MIGLPTMTQAGYTPPQKSMPPKAKSPKKPKKNKKRKKGIGTAGVVSLVIFLIAVLIGSCTLFLYGADRAICRQVFAEYVDFRLCARRV